jgi:hypothetical protein
MDVNTEAEETAALDVITSRQPVKIQQTEKLAHVVVNCRVCELVMAL